MESFESFWDEIIAPSIDYCWSQSADIYRDRIRLKKSNAQMYKNELYSLFLKKREWLKREYLSHEGSDAMLDFHKLGAILCRCIIGCKFFSFSESKAKELYNEIDSNDQLDQSQKLKIEIDNIYINYKLAYLVSIGIAYFDLFYWSIEKIHDLNKEDIEKRLFYEEFQKELKINTSLSKYKKSLRHDDFDSSMIISLMKQDYLLRDFDYLSYAANLYQMQEYTKQIIFLRIISKSNSKFKIDDINALL